MPTWATSMLSRGATECDDDRGDVSANGEAGRDHMSGTMWPYGVGVPKVFGFAGRRRARVCVLLYVPLSEPRVRSNEMMHVYEVNIH